MAAPVPGTKRRVLFLCTRNSARSQIAEGWLRWLYGDRFTAASARTAATLVRPPFPLAQRRQHWPLPDPSQAIGSEAEQLAAYRQVRDAIAARVRSLVEEARASTAVAR